MSPADARASRPHFPYHNTHGRHEVWDLHGDDTLRLAWFTTAACPFCGGLDLSVCDALDADDSRNPMHNVVCPECGCRGPWATTEELAIRHWNTWNNTETRQLSDWRFLPCSTNPTDSIL